jgi:hypothetical protein
MIKEKIKNNTGCPFNDKEFFKMNEQYNGPEMSSLHNPSL